MEGSQIELIASLTAIFLASSAALLVLDRFDHPAVPGYILAGAALGELFLQGELTGFVQLGIIFLVFVFGLKLEPERLSSVVGDSLEAAGVTVLLVSAMAYTVALQLGLGFTDAVYFSIAASLSSSLVGLELIEERLKMNLLHGRLAESIHLIQDVFAAGFLIIVSSVTSSSPVVSALTGAGLFAAAAVLREFLPDLVGRSSEGRELTLLSSLTTLTLFLAVAEFAGLPTVLGAFAAGISLAKFPFNAETLESVRPLKDFFSVVFFVSLGSLLTFPSLPVILLAAALLGFTLVVKPLMTAFYLIETGFDHRTSYLSGLSLDQISEFALIVTIIAFNAGTVSRPLFESVVIASAVSMSISSYTNRKSSWIHRKLDILGVEGDQEKRDELTNVEEVRDHLVLAGYGIQGRRIAEEFEDTDVQVVPIENDPEKVTEMADTLDSHVFGDASRRDTWSQARVEDAAVAVSTVRDPEVSEALLDTDTGADQVVSARESREAADLIHGGADLVEVSKLMAAESLVDHIKGALSDINYAEELRRRKMLELRREASRNG